MKTRKPVEPPPECPPDQDATVDELKPVSDPYAALNQALKNIGNSDW